MGFNFLQFSHYWELFKKTLCHYKKKKKSMALIIFPLQLFDVYNLSCIKLQLPSKVWVLSGLICLEN